MSQAEIHNPRRLPSVDEVLKTDVAVAAIARFGRPAAVEAVRDTLAALRADKRPGTSAEIAGLAAQRLEAQDRSSLRPVFNLTGTVLHTNLGRALIADVAIEAAVQAMRNAVSLEFDVDDGKRGERDDHVRALLCELTGAEDATVVNNNASAVLLALNTLGQGRDAIVSRGELIEIGGAFRMPDIMARAGARLVEIGTTNRTHRKDYVGAIGSDTGLVLKVHTSNYRIEGFTAEVEARELVEIARERKVPVVHDLGSGTLVDLRRFGLKHEPTVAEAVADGADLVTFSGDKLLGGPQAGFIVGRKELLAQVNRNPMKRALRVDKVRLAMLEATLKLYRDPDRLAERLPTMRLLARPRADIEAQAKRLVPVLTKAIGQKFAVDIVACASQIGSGALPLEAIASAGLALRPVDGSGRALNQLSAALRSLPIPVIGHIADQSLVLDLRCLDDEAGFIANLSKLDLKGGADAVA
ncbi:MAG: L-seryl-tRNA(Sec) selenium transferase [Rhizobiales bacterium 62-17]|nr:L-seryl-tRNA(Sec) selenium transferase [Hyphomicrobiales bacterium]OJY05707.1 MAG: L-seryl-tRNA(Sec) selenium transferase [Rhizobiales bacterium 62-17]